jgi:hypothetical protein
MKCGSCRDSHKTVDEVRDCYKQKNFVPLTTVHDGKNGQYELLQKLLAERDMAPLPPYDHVANTISKSDAGEAIALLIDNVPKSDGKCDDDWEGELCLRALSGKGTWPARQNTTAATKGRLGTSGMRQSIPSVLRHGASSCRSRRGGGYALCRI